MSDPARLPKPPWIRVPLPRGEGYERVRAIVRARSLHTVCEEARCPNVAECWGCGTATFLILGDVCTRRCRFCAVQSGNPPPCRPEEPDGVADAVAAMGLRHAVITSVTRDDLEDGGAAQFAATIRAIRRRVPLCSVEVLIPDFRGSDEALREVLAARPDILGHNMETVARLYPLARPGADYRRSLDLLRRAREAGGSHLTKSGIMVGLGEEREEVLELMADLRLAGCDLLTIGQYLSPSASHLPVKRYYTPEEFQSLRESGLRTGFIGVESAPLVRSSYHAADQTR